MKRIDFVNGLLKSCCGAALLITPGFTYRSGDNQNSFPISSDDERVKFTKGWIQRFMQILDSNLDEKKRHELMYANGKACFLSYAKERTGDKKSVESFVEEMAQYVGKENCYLKDNNIYFNYTQNHNGLKVSDGFCLCPMVEDGPKNLSPTFCSCSVGYISEMINYYIAPPKNVELLESIRTGGKKCSFRIQM